MLLGLGLTWVTQTQVLPWSCSEFRTSSSDDVYLQFRNLWYWRGWVVRRGFTEKGMFVQFWKRSHFSRQMREKGILGLAIVRCGSSQHFRSFSELKHTERCVGGGKSRKMGALAWEVYIRNNSPDNHSGVIDKKVDWLHVELVFKLVTGILVLVSH